eukprot:4882812-Karenia_brevis.AAC.1
MQSSFESVLRALAPGSGNLATVADFIHMARSFHFSGEFFNPAHMILASKLRVIDTVAPDCHKRNAELNHLLCSTCFINLMSGIKTDISRSWLGMKST